MFKISESPALLGDGPALGLQGPKVFGYIWGSDPHGNIVNIHEYLFQKMNIQNLNIHINIQKLNIHLNILAYS